MQRLLNQLNDVGMGMNASKGNSEQSSTRFPVQSVSEMLVGGFLSPGPIEARERISQRYGCSMDPHPKNCELILLIRDIFYKIDKRLIDATFLCAPHTHWGDQLIVESYTASERKYEIGPSDEPATDTLRPFSFVFSENGPMPYEWMDASVPVDSGELEEIYRIICQVSTELANQSEILFPIPLGIMIDHRFKNSIWGSRTHSFAETSSQQGQKRAEIRPVFESVLHDSEQVPDTVAVAWSANIDQAPPSHSFSKTEAEFYELLEKHISILNPEDVPEFLEFIDSELKNREKET